jgi:fucose permease
MAVSGGAFIPPLAGKIADLSGISAGMYVFVACAAYLVFVSMYSLSKK